MRRAISSVSAWSQSFQPSRSATFLAILAAPLPYSRSIVITLIVAMFLPPLLHNDCAARGRIVLPHNEREQEHDARRNSEHHERIDIGQRLRLRLERTVQASISLQLRVGGADPGVGQLPAQPIDLALERRIET